jgi:SAM-dependent methyltransferase
MAELYDSIGREYRKFRRPDPRIQFAILRALQGLGPVVNVGAGTGSYEPGDRFVVAVEPSMVMIRQRSGRAAPAVQAGATDLPFRDASFDASLAILTLHHWTDWRRGIQELARAARRRVVLLTWDPSAAGFWLVNDYFPEVLQIDRSIFPTIEALRRELGQIHVESVEIPHDCIDGFLGAYWRRPHEYLRPAVRRAISTFAKLSDVDSGLTRLRQDLLSGEWHQRHGSLLSHDSLDLGYRLVSAP